MNTSYLGVPEDEVDSSEPVAKLCKTEIKLFFLPTS